jgi:hypothetical protein
MELETQQTEAIAGYSAKQLEHWLGISNSRLRHYCGLLRQCCPDEFAHDKYSTFFTTESYRAIKIVRDYFKKGATEKQVKTLLRNQGI